MRIRRTAFERRRTNTLIMISLVSREHEGQCEHRISGGADSELLETHFGDHGFDRSDKAEMSVHDCLPMEGSSFFFERTLKRASRWENY